jgi:hypothetical protein
MNESVLNILKDEILSFDGLVFYLRFDQNVVFCALFEVELMLGEG